jgi:hypothetical protein
MSKHHRWKSRKPAHADEAADRAAEEAPVYLDVERLQKSLQSAKFDMPSGLTPEEKRQFMLAVANGDVHR